MKISEKGTLILIKREGMSNKSYPDPATKGDPWTIGVGHTGPEVKKGLEWSTEKVHDVLNQDLVKFNTGVARLIGNAITTQAQFDALVSFAFNVGLDNLGKSTLLKKHNAGDYAGAAAEFAKWNKANGQVMKGLTARRKEEATQYAGGL